MTKRSMNKGRGLFIAELVLACVLFAVSELLLGASAWIDAHFDVDIQQLLYTLASPMEGSDLSVVTDCLRDCGAEILGVVLFLLACVAIRVLPKRFSATVTADVFRWHGRFDLFKLLPHLMLLAAVFTALSATQSVDRCLKIREYLQLKSDPTTIYEDFYVDPDTMRITAPEQKKNLIYIYVESLETAYAADEDGGSQPVSCIPQLTALARDNCSFSDRTDPLQLGGWRPARGTTWTMASLFSTSAGIPFAFPMSRGEDMEEHIRFASGCTTLGDILERNGYHNMFLCGSDAVFGGRKKYYEQHGSFAISDLYTARAEGFLPEDYWDGWWGYEDFNLYEIAKAKLLELSRSGQPFDLTMLTVDTHFVEGHICALCPDTFDTNTGNIVACTDRQAAEFIQWCTQQDFYQDTVIVIVGDHPRMDNFLVDGLVYNDRTIYNCFLNCPIPDESRTLDRTFTAMDMFPTVLSALGFEIEGGRLGLGTDLFSGLETLPEQMGFDVFNGELGKYSAYYVENFA